MMKSILALALALITSNQAQAGTLVCKGKGESITLNLTIETENPLTGPAKNVSGSLKFRPDILADKTQELVDADFTKDSLTFLGKAEADEESEAHFGLGLKWSKVLDEKSNRTINYFLQLETPLENRPDQNRFTGRTVFLKFINDESTPANRFLVPTTRCYFTN